jgi:hypothetical protein
VSAADVAEWWNSDSGPGWQCPSEAAGRHGQARRAYDRYLARMREIGVEPAGAIATRP